MTAVDPTTLSVTALKAIRVMLLAQVQQVDGLLEQLIGARGTSPHPIIVAIPEDGSLRPGQHPMRRSSKHPVTLEREHSILGVLRGLPAGDGIRLSILARKAHVPRSAASQILQDLRYRGLALMIGGGSKAKWHLPAEAADGPV